MRCHTLFAAALLSLAGGGALADEISITIENTNPDEGFFLTPFWVSVHNGGFDSYNHGEFATNFPGITEIAENGNTGPISDAFAASGAGAAGGVDATIIADTIGPPVFNPGESATFNLNVGDTMVNRYFSYASMVIPSNDLFVANGDPFAHELFDVGGNFIGPVEILIFGRDVNDNGTEVNNAFGDAAFSANDGQSVPEFAVIRSFFTDAGDDDYLASFLGTQTVSGDTINEVFGADDLIARITIDVVPAPGAAALFGVALLGTRRRRRAT